MVLEGERHVVQILYARARHLDDAVALAHARAIGGTAGASVREEDAARLLLHRPVIGHRPEIGAVAAAVALARGRCGGAGVDRSRVTPCHARGQGRRQRRDARRALRVQGGRLVLRTVVLLVAAREQVEDGDPGRVEAGLIGRAIAVAAAGDLEPLLRGGRVEQRVPLRGRLRAQDEELVVAQATHHVQVDHGHGAGRGRGQGRDEA